MSDIYPSQRPPDFSIVWSHFWNAIYNLFGWRVEGEPIPNYPKLIVIGVPHTSNWDFIVFLFTNFIARMKMNWLGKHTLFKPPFGWLMRALGGVPINRTTTRNAVDAVAEAFASQEKMVLILAPEGTRSYTENWKTGFYYMALKANIPILMGYVDYATKRTGFGPHFFPSGDIEKDFELIKAFYADKHPRFPEKQGPILPSPSDKRRMSRMNATEATSVPSDKA
jgi:1-acyl-sn-glycerol-3-phosphate acyltransferase